MDNIVRVQMHRLRQKFEEYYSAKGRGDPIISAARDVVDFAGITILGR